MQKLKLQNVWNKDKKEFDKNNFELRENEKTITGKVSISGKENDKWISKPMPFIAFKSRIDAETEMTLRNAKEKAFEAEFNLSVGSFKDKEDKQVVFHRIVINKARIEMREISEHNIVKANGYQSEVEEMEDYVSF